MVEQNPQLDKPVLEPVKTPASDPLMDTPHLPPPISLPPLLERARHHATALGAEVLVRLPAPRPWKDPWSLASIALQSGERSTVWSDPEGRILAVGMGEAARVEASGEGRFRSLQTRLESWTSRVLAHEELRELPLWFGGFSFRGADPREVHQDPTWGAWAQDTFVTHEITSVKTTEGTWTVLSLRVRPSDSAAAVLAEYERLMSIVETMRRLAASSALLQSQEEVALHFLDDQSRARWSQTVDAAQEEIRGGALEKVVLARRILAPWPQSAGHQAVPARIHSALQALRTRYAHCTTFALSLPSAEANESAAFDARSQQTFFGATPELLIARAGERIHTMALAGTAPRGASADEDRAHEYALLGSEKEREEHRLVVEAIVQALGTLNVEVRPSSVPDVVSFPNVHHLRTSIHAAAPAHAGVLELAEALHPTPAVCGAPGPVAFRWLQENEPWERGWYAGGVGWLNDRMDGRISVALRSALANAEGVCAFAGAGIVEGSDADREWDETRAKLAPIRDAFAPPSAPETSSPRA